MRTILDRFGRGDIAAARINARQPWPVGVSFCPTCGQSNLLPPAEEGEICCPDCWAAFDPLPAEEDEAQS